MAHQHLKPQISLTTLRGIYPLTNLVLCLIKTLVQNSSTNDRVDDFNRDSLLEFPGTVYEFLSQDSGKKAPVTHTCTACSLVENSCPGYFAQNLSDKLVNELFGEVYDVEDSTVVVDP